MTLNQIAATLKSQGCKVETFGLGIKIERNNQIDFIEKIGSLFYLNGSCDFNIWNYLGY